MDKLVALVLTRITTTMAQIFNCKGNEKDI